MKITKTDIKNTLSSYVNDTIAELHAQTLETILFDESKLTEAVIVEDEDEDGVDVEPVSEDCTDDICEYAYTEFNEDTLEERRIIIRINSKGRRIKRIKCPPGRVVKNVNGRAVCSTPTGRERLTKKLAIKRANRTKKAKGAGFARRVNFKRQRALKKRKQMGLPKQNA